MNDADDPADYLARRYSVVHAAAKPATLEELRRACEERGALVHLHGRLLFRGMCLGSGRFEIHLPDGTPPQRAAHELFHAWLRDNIAHGVDYAAPEWEQYPEELAADRFGERVAAG